MYTVGPVCLIWAPPRGVHLYLSICASRSICRCLCENVKLVLNLGMKSGAGASPLAMLVKQAPLQKIVRSMRAGFSALTTGLLHWLTGPYVHALEYTPATQRLRIRTLSVLCQTVHTDVPLREVRTPERPMQWPWTLAVLCQRRCMRVCTCAQWAWQSNGPAISRRPCELSRAGAYAWCILPQYSNNLGNNLGMESQPQLACVPACRHA